MKILLINPSYTTSVGLSLSYAEPLGLAYIAASVEKSEKHEVEIFDAIGEATSYQKKGNNLLIGLAEEESLKIISTKTFDVLGVSITRLADNFFDIINFLTKLRERYPKIPIVIGGPEATLEYEAYMSHGIIDFVVLGEGEETIVELLDALSGEKELSSVLGLVYRDEAGNIVKNTLRPPLDINKINWPARHLLPLNNYLKNKTLHMLEPAASILTSRSCPANCRFCNIKAIWGRQWRGRSPYDVVSEIYYLVKNYGVREILIQDDNFMANPKRVEAICDEIINRKLDIVWQVQPGLALWLLTKDLVTKMRGSGLHTLCPQIETGNQKTLTYINKKINFKHAQEIIQHANKLGMVTQTNIIIGFYFETKKDIEESIQMAESLGVDKIDYILAIPKKHTLMYEDYCAEGLIKDGDPVKMPIDICHITGEELVKTQCKANRNHYLIRFFQMLNPISFFQEFIPKVNSYIKIRYIMRRVLAERGRNLTYRKSNRFV